MPPFKLLVAIKNWLGDVTNHTSRESQLPQREGGVGWQALKPLSNPLWSIADGIKARLDHSGGRVHKVPTQMWPHKVADLRK